MLTLSSLKSHPRRTPKRLGRGNGSGRGSYSGRGIKGQKARSGSRKGLKLHGLKATFKSIPKVKGFKSMYANNRAIGVGDLEKRWPKATTIHIDDYKLLSQGEVSKALTVYVAAVSQAARTKIEQRGGKIIICGKPS